MIFSIIVAIAIAFAAIICYSSCVAASRADRQSEEYYYLKMQEMEAKRKNENLKNE